MSDLETYPRPGDAASAGRTGRGETAFGLIQIAAFASLLATTLAPGYRGGYLVAALLAGMLALQLAATARHALRNGITAPAADMPARLWLLALVSCAVLAVVVVLGIVLGGTLALFAYWRFVARFGTLRTAWLSLAFGVAVPIVFARLVQASLWPGLIPPLIDGLLGGGVLPPL